MTLETIQKIQCPLCGTKCSPHNFGRAGISMETLSNLIRHIENQNLDDILNLGEISLQRLEPESTSKELSLMKSITSLDDRIQGHFKEFRYSLQRLESSWTGVAKGQTSEIIVANILHQLFPEDKFDQSKSSNKTDIIAIVDKNNETGKICISVKNTKNWNSSSQKQIEENMKQESTNWGILVTMKLPRGARPEGTVIHADERYFIIVHPEYLPSVYAVMRDYVVATKEFNDQMYTKEQQLLQIHKISSLMAEFVESEDYKEFTKAINSLIKELDKAENDIRDFESFVEKYNNNVRKKFQKMRQVLTQQLGLAEKIKKIFLNP